MKRLPLALTYISIILIGQILQAQRSYSDNQSANTANEAAEGTVSKITKSDEQWQKELTAIQYQVTRRQATEPPFSGEYYALHKDGIYRCVCCGAILFDSKQKYDSSCGWPSFWAPKEASNIVTRADHSHNMERIEITCSQCGAHLGHVFDDGPAPTNLRYCVNSASLKFEQRH